MRTKKTASMGKTISLALVNRTGLLFFLATLLIFNSCRGDGEPTMILAKSIGTQNIRLKYQGEIREAKAWIENGDSTILVISDIQRGEVGERNYFSEIFAYKFKKGIEGWNSEIQMKEANQSPNDIVHYHPESIQISDADGNGQADVCFFYSIASDGGTEPLTLKMMYFWNNTKAPIRGKVPRELDDTESYIMKLDPNLNSAPKKIQDHAVQLWKSYIIKNYSDFVPNP